MRTFATLKNFTTPEGRDKVIRNLNRILDIVILDIDIENSTITFLHAGQTALEKARRELNCLGFPIQNLQIQNGKNADAGLTGTSV
ncbi:MAG: hypothetical protein ACR2MT_16735 [Aurantibacter sp.]